MLRRVAALTFCLNCCEGPVKVCIWRQSVSGIVHHVGRRVAYLDRVASVGAGVGGLDVYMAHSGGRGAIASMSTLIVCSRYRVS